MVARWKVSLGINDKYIQEGGINSFIMFECITNVLVLKDDFRSQYVTTALPTCKNECHSGCWDGAGLLSWKVAKKNDLGCIIRCLWSHWQIEEKAQVMIYSIPILVWLDSNKKAHSWLSCCIFLIAPLFYCDHKKQSWRSPLITTPCHLLVSDEKIFVGVSQKYFTCGFVSGPNTKIRVVWGRPKKDIITINYD